MSFRAELKPMLRLAVPVVLAELGWMSMGIVDTLMVSPIGPAAIGAAGIGTSLHMAFAVFGMGLLLGLDTFVSQAYGARDVEDCHRWLVQGVWLAAFVTVPLMLVCVVVLLAIPSLGFHPEVMPPLHGYFAIVIWSTLPLLLYAAFRRYLQGMHIVTPVMFALISANVVNAVSNWVFIYGNWGAPAMGVPGAAWATVVSRVYMMSVLLVTIIVAAPSAWLRVGRWRRSVMHAVSWRLDTARLRRLVSLGFPAASQVTLEVGVFAAATALAGQLDPVSSASHQIALNIAAFAFMVPLGVASAGAVRVGNRIGARDPQGARRAGWTAIVLGVGFMAATGVLFLAAPRFLIGLFSREPSVLSLGASLLFVAAVFQLFDGLQAVATGTLRGLGDTRTPMVTNLAGHWLIGLPFGYVLCFPLGVGVIGLWWGLSAGLIVCGVVLLGVWYKRSSQLSAGSTLRMS